MLRTTVRLPDDLLEAAKQRARQTGRTLTELLEHALRAELAHADSSSRVAERGPVYQAHATIPPGKQSSADLPAQQVSRSEHLATQVEELQRFLAAQPDRDHRVPDEILGYDAFGLPG